MKNEKSKLSKKYFGKKSNKRRKANTRKEEKTYYSTEVLVTEDENLELRPQINFYIISLDDKKNKKELDNYAYQKYIRKNCQSKKSGGSNE